MEFQEIKPIAYKELKEKFNNFRPPRSYFILDNQPEILKLLNNQQLIGEKIIHNFKNIEAREVCIY